MQLAYQQAQSTYNNKHTPYTNHTIPSHTSSHTPYVADYTLFVKNTLEMTEKHLSTRKKTNEANTTSKINPSITTTTKKKKKSTPTTTPPTADNNNNNNNITVLPTINSESPSHTHTQPLLIGADLLSIPRIGTKAVAALLAYIGSTTGSRIVEELLVEVTVRPYATTTGIGRGKTAQASKVVVDGNNDNIELINVIQSDNNNDADDDTNQVVSDTTTTDIVTTLDAISATTSPPPSFSTSSNDGNSGSTTSAKSKSKSSSINRSIVSKSYLPLLKEVVVFTGKFSSMTRSGAGAVSEKLGTR